MSRDRAVRRALTPCTDLGDAGQQYARYNSLVNNVKDPSIFVVQHSSQAYPAYLITYH